MTRSRDVVSCLRILESAGLALSSMFPSDPMQVAIDSSNWGNVDKSAIIPATIVYSSATFLAKALRFLATRQVDAISSNPSGSRMAPDTSDFFIKLRMSRRPPNGSPPLVTRISLASLHIFNNRFI